MEPLARLQAGITQAETVIGRIDKGQYDLPTPCAEWNVGQVINHMISALTMFRETAEHGECDPAILAQDLIGDDAVKSLVTEGAGAVAGWSVPGMMDGMANLPIGVMPAQFALQLPASDMLVHSWDVATATGLQVDWDPDLVADTLSFIQQNLADPAVRGEYYAAPVQVSADADDMTKVVTFLGRTP